MKDIHEQVFAHPIAPPKIVDVCCIVGEVVVVQHSMTLQTSVGASNVFFPALLLHGAVFYSSPLHQVFFEAMR
jgi:hypothetical protein